MKLFPRASALWMGAALLSGASCLVCEVVWSRYLHLIFGVSAYAVATVLACFMLGLAAGSWHLGHKFDRAPHPARLLAAVQAGLGLYLALSPCVYQWVSVLDAHLMPALAPTEWGRQAVRGLLAFAALFIPTYLMGGTVPGVIKLATVELGRVGADIGRVYAINTLGGMVGAMAAGFWLLPSIGLSSSLYCAAGLNFLAAFLVLRAGRVTPEASVMYSKPPKFEIGSGISPGVLWLALAVYALSGFTALAYQVFWTRALTFFYRDSVYDLALVLTVFLGGLVIGSFGSGMWLRRRRGGPGALAVTQILIGLSALGGLYLIARFPYWLNHLQTNTALVSQHGEAYWQYAMLIRTAYAVLLMGVPTVLFGACLPLAGQLMAQNLPSLAGRLGFLMAMNSVGAALGAVLAGFVFLAHFGLQNSIMGLAWLNVGLGVVLLVASGGIRSWPVLVTSLAAAVVATFCLPPWDKLRMSTSFLDQNQPIEELLELQYYREDAQGLTSVVELLPLQRRYLVTNRLFAQNTSEMNALEDHRRLGQIPLLLHPKPLSVLAIGLGAGVTLRGVNDLQPVAIDCVELSEGVVAAARIFQKENGGVLDDPKVKLSVDDGRHFLRASEKLYDVIVLDIFFPMSAGSSSVYSREYYELCRAHLQPGGFVCQWLPAHQLSLADIKTIAATFQSVFPRATLWYGLIGDSVSVVGLIGGAEELKLDYARVTEVYQTPGLADRLRPANLQRPELLLSHYMMGPDALAKFTAGAARDTDDRPVIEYSAPKLPLQARRQGMENLIALSNAAGEVAVPLAGAENTNSAVRESLARYLTGKRVLVDGLRMELANAPDDRLRFYEAALRRDPANEDLRSTLELLSTP